MALKRLAAAMAFMAAAGAGHVAAADFRLLVLDGAIVKWGPATAGTGADVSWSFVNSSVNSAKARNCAALVPLDGLAKSSHLPAQTLRDETQAAFEAWENVTALQFRYTPDASKADILIGAQGKPAGRAFTNVALSNNAAELALPGKDDVPATAARGIRSIRQALICLNPAQRWKAAMDGNLDVYDLRYTLTHEIGHAIGLDHPGSGGALMGFRYQEKFPALRDGDIAAAQKLYGVRRPMSAQGQ